MTSPERIWAWPVEGSGNTYGLWSVRRSDDGGVQYTRSDLGDRDAIRAEAFEEAAQIAERAGRKPVGAGDGSTYVIGSCLDAAAAIRAKAKRGLALAEHARLSGELLGSEGSDGDAPCR